MYMNGKLYMHFKYKSIELHTPIDYIYCTTDLEEGIGSTSIDVSDELTIFVHTNDIEYLIVFDESNKRRLLIKDGKIRKINE